MPNPSARTRSIFGEQLGRPRAQAPLGDLVEDGEVGGRPPQRVRVLGRQRRIEDIGFDVHEERARPAQPCRQRAVERRRAAQPVELRQPFLGPRGCEQVIRTFERVAFRAARQRLVADHVAAGAMDERLEDRAHPMSRKQIGEGAYAFTLG
jgi:hypothetical protein